MLSLFILPWGRGAKGGERKRCYTRIRVLIGQLLRLISDMPTISVPQETGHATACPRPKQRNSEVINLVSGWAGAAGR